MGTEDPKQNGRRQLCLRTQNGETAAVDWAHVRMTLVDVWRHVLLGARGCRHICSRRAHRQSSYQEVDIDLEESLLRTEQDWKQHLQKDPCTHEAARRVELLQSEIAELELRKSQLRQEVDNLEKDKTRLSSRYTGRAATCGEALAVKFDDLLPTVDVPRTHGKAGRSASCSAISSALSNAEWVIDSGSAETQMQAPDIPLLSAAAGQEGTNDEQRSGPSHHSILSEDDTVDESVTAPLVENVSLDKLVDVECRDIAQLPVAGHTHSGPPTGGTASGLKHVVPEGHHCVKLYQVRKRHHKTIVHRVPLSRHVIHDDDCYILDAEDKIYVLHGESASPFAKEAAAVYATNLEREHERGTITFDIDEEFWAYLQDDDADRGGDADNYSNPDDSHVDQWRVQVNTHVEEKHEPNSVAEKHSYEQTVREVHASERNAPSAAPTPVSKNVPLSEVLVQVHSDVKPILTPFDGDTVTIHGAGMAEQRRSAAGVPLSGVTDFDGKKNLVEEVEKQGTEHPQLKQSAEVLDSVANSVVQADGARTEAAASVQEHAIKMVEPSAQLPMAELTARDRTVVVGRRRADSAPPRLTTGGTRPRMFTTLNKRRSCTAVERDEASMVRGRVDSRECKSVREITAEQTSRQHTDSDQQTKVEEVADEFVEGEEWVQFMVRSSKCLSEAGIPQEVAKLFETFRVSADLEIVFASFAQLFHLASAPQRQGGKRKTPILTVAPPWDVHAPGRQWRYPYEPIRVLLGGSWKAKQLWSVLDKRCNKKEYVNAPCTVFGHSDGGQCLVVGAGPCGLRTAIELRLLGARVTVVDQRTSFSRINQLHLWSWCYEELKQLGARILEPPPSDFGADPALLHIGISHLQIFLLKVALLLGVEVLLGTKYVRSEWTGSSWRAVLLPRGPSAGEGKVSTNSATSEAQQFKMPPSPASSSLVEDLAILVGASGFGCTLGDDAGMATLESGLRDESSIGLICNFARTHGKCEQKLQSFNMAKQFYVALFKQLAKETGAELENIVYTKSHQSHYFVMTPTRRCLCDAGVVIDDTRVPLLVPENLDRKRLDEFVRRVVAFPFKKGVTIHAALCEDGRCDQPSYADSGPGLFDFSKMKRSSEGLVFVDPPAQPALPMQDGDDDSISGNDHSLLVSLVGDALVEPFWPEGLGISRGFFGVWDVCSAISLWAQGHSQGAVVQHFQEAFVQLKSMSSCTKARMLQQENQFALTPASRYRVFQPSTRRVSYSPERSDRKRNDHYSPERSDRKRNDHSKIQSSSFHF